MHWNVGSSIKRHVAQAALLVLCVSPLVGVGNIIARNRSIENAGRMQQGRIDALSGSWQGAQRRIAAANEMLAACRINEGTAMSEASKAMASKDVANKQAELNRLLKEADEVELRMSRQAAGFIPIKQNGWQNVLGVMLAMGLSAIVWRWARTGDAARATIPAYVGILCVGVLLATALISFGQSPVAPNTNTVVAKPLQPGGVLGDQLGVYRTIEGSLSEGLKVETGTLLVDMVDGKKLDKPIPLAIRGAIIVNHNLQSARLSLPPKQRCILKGFESGEMIGVPPAVAIAAEEQGWKEVPMSPVHWQWRPYFVALVVVEPKGLEQEAVIREANRQLKDPNRVLLAQLQGTWTMTAMVLPGGKTGTVSNPAETGVMIRFDDKSGYISQGTGDEGSKFTYTVDVSTSPAEIDLKYANGTHALGLIEIKNGTLELQLGAGGDARPSSKVKPSIHQLYRRTNVYWQWIPSRE